MSDESTVAEALASDDNDEEEQNDTTATKDDQEKAFVAEDFDEETPEDETRADEWSEEGYYEDIQSAARELIRDADEPIPERYFLLELKDADIEGWTEEEIEEVVDSHTVTDEDDGVLRFGGGFSDVSDDSDLTWDHVRRVFNAEPMDISEANVKTSRGVTDFAIQKTFELMNEKYDWMHIKDDDAGINEWLAYNPATGIYNREAESVAALLMDQNLGWLSNSQVVNEVNRKLKTANRVYDVRMIDGGERNVRCLENCVLDVDSLETEPFDPDLKMVYKLPTPWDPDVDRSEVQEFLNSITWDDTDRKVIEEMAGDMLTDHYRRSWFGVVYGPGANGKSMLFYLIRKTLGDRNVTGESVHDIVNTRWASARLAGGDGSLANLDADVGGETIDSPQKLKKLTGNTDQVSHENKGSAKFDAVNSCKLWFGTNKPFAFTELIEAMERRIKPVEMPFKFKPKDEYDPDNPLHKERELALEEQLGTEKNRAAMLQIMVDALKRLRENDGFSYEKSQKELFAQYQSEADPFFAFKRLALQNVRTDYDDTGTPIYLTFNEIYAAYCSFCHENNKNPVDENVFARKLNKVGDLDVEKYHPADADGANSRKYLTFTKEGFEHAMTSTAKRFMLRVDHEDVVVPDKEADEVSKETEDEDENDADGDYPTVEGYDDGLQGQTHAAINRNADGTDSGVGFATIYGFVSKSHDVSEIELRAAILEGIEDGEFAMVEAGAYAVVGDEDE